MSKKSKTKSGVYDVPHSIPTALFQNLNREFGDQGAALLTWANRNPHRLATFMRNGCVEMSADEQVLQSAIGSNMITVGEAYMLTGMRPDNDTIGMLKKIPYGPELVPFLSGRILFPSIGLSLRQLWQMQPDFFKHPLDGLVKNKADAMTVAPPIRWYLIPTEPTAVCNEQTDRSRRLPLAVHALARFLFLAKNQERIGYIKDFRNSPGCTSHQHIVTSDFAGNKESYWSISWGDEWGHSGLASTRDADKLFIGGGMEAPRRIEHLEIK